MDLVPALAPDLGEAAADRPAVDTVVRLAPRVLVAMAAAQLVSFFYAWLLQEAYLYCG